MTGDWYPPLPVLLRKLPPPGAGQFPQLQHSSGSAQCPWDTTRETLSTELDKWQIRAVFCQSWQALAAKPGKRGKVPSLGVPFPVTNKEWAVSFWTQQLVLEGQLSDLLCAISWFGAVARPTVCYQLMGGQLSYLLCAISCFGGSCQTYCVPSAHADFGSSSGTRKGLKEGETWRRKVSGLVSSQEALGKWQSLPWGQGTFGYTSKFFVLAK